MENDVVKLQEAVKIAAEERGKIITEIVKKLTERKNSNADMRHVDFVRNLKRLIDDASLYGSLRAILHEELPNDIKYPDYDETLELALAVAAEVNKRKRETADEALKPAAEEKRITRTRRTKA